ncbi:MAG: 50S ribosomal protein L17 [Chloroflexi bacterium]|nr:50S ribosomal protein L17 [Chloroflexota bacterium]
MRHKVKTTTLGRDTAHRLSMLRNLATSLIVHKRIETTNTRAKEVSQFVEKLVTWAKKKDLSGKRQVFRYITNRDAARELFEELAPRFEDRKGGYTRIIKKGFRKGDNAPLSIIEFVE